MSEINLGVRKKPCTCRRLLKCVPFVREQPNTLKCAQQKAQDTNFRKLPHDLNKDNFAHNQFAV